MVLNSLDQVLELARAKPPKRVVVAAADDEHALAALNLAVKERIVNPILVGDKKRLERMALNTGFPVECSEIIDESNPVEASRIAVTIIRDGEAEMLMKGLVSTAELLHAVLNRENGIGTGVNMTHAAMIECPGYHKLLCVTDAGINVSPGLREKVGMVKNAVSIYTKLRLDIPKVAVLAAVEVVNEKMRATMDAAMLTQMNRRGQIKDCIIDGPFAFDNIVSKDACAYKGIVSEIGGDADIVLCPEIETANTLYKALTYLAGGTVAAIVLGAAVPVILNSRTDSEKSKLMSIALAAAMG